MTSSIKSLVTVVAPEESVDTVIRRMAKESRDVKNPGIVVVLDEQDVLLGIMTDGDIRRAYSDDIPFSSEISTIMIKEPITISEKIPEDSMASEVIRKVQLDERHHSEWIRHVLVVDDKNRLTNIIDYLDILQDHNGSVNRVAIFGMGYVGVTLAVSLANRGHQVTGIDVQRSVVDSLNQGESHVFEPGLSDMLATNLKRKSIDFGTILESERHQVYIVAVGTPLDLDSKPDLVSLTEVLKVISGVLQSGDQVMLRSTVPVGVTRETVIPYLENKTGLIAGEDFYVSFAPERTIEGRAMYELKTLPQVVGGYSSQCVKRSTAFWSTLTPTVVRVDSLEASEMVKLANNTFRDLSFSFANELALLADKYNVNSFDLVNAANEGYPRNKIPLPSPGVGGYCLTKDPILFSCTAEGPRADAVLGISSRKVNEKAKFYPIELIERYAKRLQVPLSELNILIIGIAFKGMPETTDVRASVAIDVFNELNSRVNQIFGWDAVINSKELQGMGFKVIEDIVEIIDHTDVVLILNNHPDNVCSDMYASSQDGRLIFDGWNQLDRVAVEKIPGLIYATMGYMTP
jgi:UDP-N-acetyl-D-mannosaminuronic acid dehydrogenase